MTDYLIAVCKLCGHTVRISLEHGGRRAKCPKCEGIIDIPKSDTSIRLRSDLELTREARAKAGRGPDSDPDQPAVRSAPDRHMTSRVRRVAVKPASSARKWTLIVTLVATAAIVAGIAIVLLKTPSGDTAAPPAPSKPAPPPPSSPAPPADPYARSRGELTARLADFVRAFNTHNLARMKPFYACDEKTLMTAFKDFGLDTEVSYEKPEAKIDFASDDEATLTLTVDRILTDTAENTSTTERVERVLTWERKEGKWLIASLPEP